MKQKKLELKNKNLFFEKQIEDYKALLEEKDFQINKLIAGFQSDMIIVKNEWEKKCYEIETMM